MDKDKKGIEELSSFSNLIQNKKQFITFLLFAIAALFSIIFLFKMSLSGLTLIYIILLSIGSIGLAYYSYFVKNKNTNILFLSLVVLIIGFVLRVIQCSINQNLEYTIKYLLFFVATIMIFYNLYKYNETKNKNLIIISLIIVALDTIYSYFSLGNISFLGHVWKFFLITESLLSIGLTFSTFDLNSNEKLNDSCKKITEKFPKIIIIIGVVLGLAIVLYLINMSSVDSNTSYDPVTGNDNSNGTIIQNKEEAEIEETDSIEKINIYKGKSTYIKTEYSNDEYEAEITVSDMYISNKILPPTPRQSYYSYYEAKEGKTYLALVLEVKNVGSQTINSDYLFTNFLGKHCTSKAIFGDKYEYTSGTVVGLDKDNSGDYDFDRYYYIDALETVKLYVIYEISSEVSDKTATINTCFGDVNLNVINEAVTY